MLYFKDTNGEIFAYETDAERKEYGPTGLVKASDAEVAAAQAPPADVVPVKVSRFQARRALKDAGVFAQVEAAIAQADEFTQDAWADAQEFRRDSQMILTLGTALDLDLDALFISAAKIEA